MATITTAGSGDWDAGATWTGGSVPADGDTASIESGHTCTLTEDEQVGAVVINGGTIAGGGFKITCVKTSGRLFDHSGTITGNLDVELQGTHSTTEDFHSSGNINHLILNGSGLNVDIGRDTTLGNLTITQGTLNTNSTHNHALTVTGATSITGTLTCNSSAISLGNNVDDAWSVVVEAGGTFDGGSGTHHLGAVTLNSSSNQFTFSSGTTNLTGRSSSGNQYKVFNNFTAGKVTAAGTQVVDQARTPTSIRCDDTTGINNLTMNSGSGRVLHLEGDLTVGGNLTVSAGTVTTRNHQDNTDNDLTVTGAADVTGTFTLNNSAVSLGALRCNSGAVLSQSSNGTLELTSATAANAAGFGDNYSLKNDDGTSDINFGGTITVSAGTYFLGGTAPLAASVINNLIVNDSHYWVGSLTVGGYMTINASKHWQTYGSATGGSRAIKVTGDLTINGQLTTYKANELDLAAEFGSLTIASGGTYTATSGTTTITSNTATGTRSVYNNGGTFTHNKGTLKIDTGAATNYDFDGDDLYNFTVECEDGSGALTCDGEASTAVTVLNNLDIKMGILRTNANSFTIHGNVFVRETSLTNKNKFVAQGANQTVKGLITVEDGAFFDMQNQGSGSFGTLTTGGIRVL